MLGGYPAEQYIRELADVGSTGSGDVSLVSSSKKGVLKLNGGAGIIITAGCFHYTPQEPQLL
jgi:hypothetical protein